MTSNVRKKIVRENCGSSETFFLDLVLEVRELIARTQFTSILVETILGSPLFWLGIRYIFSAFFRKLCIIDVARSFF